MKKILFFFMLICFSACELITIGGNSTYIKEEVLPDITYTTPKGAVYLFKSEIDSNNIQAIGEMIVSKSGEFYPAIKKYEIYEELERYRRIYNSKKLSAVNVLEENEKYALVSAEFDYKNKVTFKTYLKNNIWYLEDFTGYYE